MPLVLLPGACCNPTLLAPQRAVFPDLIVPPWLDTPDPAESLPAYARRLADSVEFPRPLYLGGISLGSFVAQELALLLKPDALILIASAREARQLRRARLGCALADLTPKALLHWEVTVPGCYFMAYMEARGARDVPPLRAATATCPPNHPRWAFHAIRRWAPPAQLPCPVLSLHGGADHVIPGRPGPGTVVVPGAGHLLNLTHADAVNRVIAEFIER